MTAFSKRTHSTMKIPYKSAPLTKSTTQKIVHANVCVYSAGKHLRSNVWNPLIKTAINNLPCVGWWCTMILLVSTQQHRHAVGQYMGNRYSLMTFLELIPVQKQRFQNSSAWGVKQTWDAMWCTLFCILYSAPQASNSVDFPYNGIQYLHDSNKIWFFRPHLRLYFEWVTLHLC